MSTMADSDDYRRMYGDDMGYGPPPEYDNSPPARRHRQQRRGSVTERMTYVPDSYVQPTSYSTHTRSYTFQEFMQEPCNQLDYKNNAAPQMEYGYQPTPARQDFRRDGNNYGYEYYGYDNPTTTVAPAERIDNNDYGYDTYGYENHSMDDTDQPSYNNNNNTGVESDLDTPVEPAAEKSIAFTNSVPALDVEPEDANRALSPPPSA